MKKSLIAVICLVNAMSVFAVEYPLMAFGLKTYSSSKYDTFDNFYFDGSYNDSFASIAQKFTDNISVRHDFDFVYKSDIGKAKNLSDLRDYVIANKITFVYKNKFVKIQVGTKPIAASDDSAFYFKQVNLFAVKATPSKYFNMEASYQNSYLLKTNQTMTHKIQFTCGWYFEKAKFMKFKANTTVYLQNGIYENQNIPPLKKISVNLYCAIDFNKASFDRIFNALDEKFKEYDDFD